MFVFLIYPIQVVCSKLRKECRCHGVTGTCNIKTCWKELALFNVVGQELKRKYHSAVWMSFVNSTWFTRKNMRKWRWIRRKCRSLCNSCNLRHWTVERYRQVKCRCKFVWSCTVRCELCTEKYSFTTCGWKWWTTCSFWNLNIALYWKLDRECHVDFCMFLTPHELNFELLMKTQKRKMKRNAWKLSCILLFWNTVFIRSCPVVYVLYTLRVHGFLCYC